MASDKPAEKDAEAVKPSNLIIADHDSTEDRRSPVAVQYKTNLEARKSNPDRILYDGEDLTHLDEGEPLESRQHGLLTI